MLPELLLEHHFPEWPAAYNEGGNLQLDGLLGAVVIGYDKGTDMVDALDARIGALRAEGHRLRNPLGGSSVIGAFGYRTAAVELLRQAAELDLEPAEIVHATSSGGTQAGLIAGLALRRSDVPVLGIDAGGSAAYLEPIVRTLAEGVIERLGVDRSFGPDAVRIDDTHVGDAYGEPTGAMWEAVELCAHSKVCCSTPCTRGKRWLASSTTSERVAMAPTTRSSSFTPAERQPPTFAYRQ